MWTEFYDMHSGGGTKEPPYEHIYIEAPIAEATVIFYNRFGHSPERVSCTCCGDDYSINEYATTLEQATGYQRNCAFAWFNVQGEEMPEDWDPRSLDPKNLYSTAYEQGYTQQTVERQDPDRSYRKYMTINEYKNQDDVLIISEFDIKDEERLGTVPSQGYVWVDG